MESSTVEAVEQAAEQNEKKIVAALKRAGMQHTDPTAYEPEQLSRALGAKPQQRGARLRQFILSGEEGPISKSNGEAPPAEKPKGEKASPVTKARQRISEEDKVLVEGAMARANHRPKKKMGTKIRGRELRIIRDALKRQRKQPSDLGSVEELDKAARAMTDPPEAVVAFCKKVGDPIVRPRLCSAVLAEMQEAAS